MYPERRKIFCNGQKIFLTVKEYELLYLLSANPGKVMTYEQMYENVWKDYAQNIRNSTISQEKQYKKKISFVLPAALFEIRCVREVGYCLEVNSKQYLTTVCHFEVADCFFLSKLAIFHYKII